MAGDASVQLVTSAEADAPISLKHASPSMEQLLGFAVSDHFVSPIDLSNKIKGAALRVVALERVFMEFAAKRTVVVTEPDWITFGVVTDKPLVKRSRRGTEYVAVTISDLRGAEVAAVFVGECINAIQRIGMGAAIAIANARIRMGNTAFGLANSIAVASPSQLLHIGTAANFALCGAKEHENDAQCKRAVDTSRNTQCPLHLTRQLNDIGARRMDLNRTTPMAFFQRRVSLNAADELIVKPPPQRPYKHVDAPPMMDTATYMPGTFPRPSKHSSQQRKPLHIQEAVVSYQENVRKRIRADDSPTPQFSVSARLFSAIDLTSSAAIEILAEKQIDKEMIARLSPQQRMEFWRDKIEYLSSSSCKKIHK